MKLFLIYKPLKNRINIIITKNHLSEINFEDENILVFNDFDFCYQHLKDENDKGNLLGEKFIIGGSQIYNYVFNNYLKYVNKIYETNINHNHSNQIHYVNSIHNNYKELDFNISTYNNFKLLNSRYCDEHEVKIIPSYDKLHGVRDNS